MGIIRFALKSTVAGGIVYYTVQEGLWSTPDETIKFYSKLYNSVAPLIQNNAPKDIMKEIPDLPSVGTMTNCARGMWNRGVITSIKYVSELPTHASNGIDTLLSNVKKMIDGPTESKKPQ